MSEEQEPNKGISPTKDTSGQTDHTSGPVDEIGADQVPYPEANLQKISEQEDRLETEGEWLID
jgi:hypothetical protein